MKKSIKFFILYLKQEYKTFNLVIPVSATVDYYWMLNNSYFKVECCGKDYRDLMIYCMERFHLKYVSLDNNFYSANIENTFDKIQLIKKAGVSHTFLLKAIELINMKKNVYNAIAELNNLL